MRWLWFPILEEMEDFSVASVIDLFIKACGLQKIKKYSGRRGMK